MKKVLLLLLILSLTGCAAPAPETPPPAVEVLAPAPVDNTRYLGIAAAAHVAKSMHATCDFPGYARTEIAVAAVVVDGSGVIRACTIDGLSATIPFDDAGGLLLPNGTVFPSNRTLGQGYGMHKASPLGTEWYQQADDFAGHCVGKRAAQLHPGDTVTSVTISTELLLQAVCRAADSAQTPIFVEDTPALACRAVITGSFGGSAEEGLPGLACLRATALACTESGAQLSCSLLSAVPFTAAGRIDCDISQGLSPLSDVLFPTAAYEPELTALREILWE